MDPVIIVYQMDGVTKVVSFKYTSSLAKFTEMCREFGYPFEVYVYNEENGFTRTVRWPAKI